MMATHFGSESNFTKLTQGFGWNSDTVRAVADEYLDEADWKYVQHILDGSTKLLPKVQALYRDVTGLAMEKVEATPIKTKFGTLPGGYRHITYNLKAVGKAEDPEGKIVNTGPVPSSLDPKDLGMWGSRFESSVPANGYTVARTNFTAPLDLSHDILHLEFESVIHDLAYRRPLIQAKKILDQPGVRRAIQEVLGPEYNSVTRRWLKDIAHEASYDQATTKNLSGLARGFRRNFTVAQVAANVSTILKHGGIAASHMSGEASPVELGAASADILRDDSLKTWVHDTFGEVRVASTHYDRDVREFMQEAFMKQGFVSRAQYAAFFAFGKVKEMESYMLALAKYRQQFPLVGHEEAVALANKAVRDTQGAGATVDLPALWRSDDKGWWSEIGKLTNMFTSFENTTTNRLWTVLRRSTRPGQSMQFRDAGWAGGKRDFDKNMSDLMAYYIIPAVYTTLFDKVKFGAKVAAGALAVDQVTDKNSYLWGFLNNMLKGAMGGTVVGNLIVDLPREVQTGFKETPGNPLGEATQEIGFSTLNAYNQFVPGGDDSKVDPRWVKHAADSVGYVTGLPTKPVATAGQFLYDRENGRVDDMGAAAFFDGLIFGTPPAEMGARSRSRGHRR
jgi:hypothetical protein